MVAGVIVFWLMGLMGLVRKLSAEPRGTEKRRTESRTFRNGGEGNPKAKLLGTVAFETRNKISGNGGF